VPLSRKTRRHPKPVAAIARAFAIFALLACTAQAQDAASLSAAAAVTGPVTVLPKMTVAEEMVKAIPLFPKVDVAKADFSDKSAPIDLFYPGEAYSEGVTQGDATVGVMLDEKGNATDYLLIRYTKKYFGDALMREAHLQLFNPRRVKGVAVPGRFNFGHRFVPTIVIEMTSFNAIEERDSEIEGGPRAIYEPHLERELDNGGLERTAATVAFIPDGYAPPPGKPIKAFVSFYVDEKGHVRLPNVEGASSPLLVPNAIKAIEHWEFKPPTVKGKPVLVFAIWTVSFEPFTPSSAPAAPRP
jgi:hypothetical protein